MLHRTSAARLHAELLEDRAAPVNLRDLVAAQPYPGLGLAPPPPVALHDLAVGYGRDGTFTVRYYQDPATYREFTPAYSYAGYRIDRIHVAAGDVTGDGVTDVITALSQISNPAPPPLDTPLSAAPVHVYDGTTLNQSAPTPVRTLRPFGFAFLGGHFLTTGDLDRDGRTDLVVSQDRSGPGRVAVYRGADLAAAAAPEPVAAFDGIEDPHWYGGAHAAVGDLNADAVPDVLVGAGVGGGPRVAAFDGTTIGPGLTPQKVFNDFYAFDPATHRAGVHVAVFDANADGFGEVLASNRSGPPRMRAFDGADLIATFGGTLTVRWDRLYGNTASTGGLRIAVKNLNADARPDWVLSHADGPRVTTVFGPYVFADGFVFRAAPSDVPGPTSALGVWVG